MRVIKALVLSLTTVFWSQPLIASNMDAMHLLQDMVQAMQNLSYQGRFVYRHDDVMESMLITHINDEQGERDSLLSLNGEAREVFRDENKQTCVWPNSEKIVIDERQSQRFSPLWIPDDIKRLSKFYEFKIIGNDRIAGHESTHLQVMPKDAYRYGYEIWIDTKTKLLLKSDMLDEQGKSIEQVMFTQLELIPTAETSQYAVLPSLNQNYQTFWQQSVNQSKSDINNDWVVNQLPAGFWQNAVVRQDAQHPDKQQLIYTDGLSSVSIFIEPVSAQSLRGMSSMGAVHAFGVVKDNLAVTAVGEVPLATVELLAKTLVKQ